MNHATLVQPKLSLIARDADGELLAIQNTLTNPVRVGGRGDVEEVLGRMAWLADQAVRDGHPPVPRSLDLIGHSIPDGTLLLGDWVIDGTRSKVRSFFRGLADCDLPARLGLRSVRLLGCETAVSEAGRHTLIALADILEVEVCGTAKAIGADAYDATGFRDDLAHVLVSARELRQPLVALVKRGGEPYRRSLDVDSLPASPLSASRHPLRVADGPAARRILELIRRDAGAQMPGLDSASCEVALPSLKTGWFHRLEIVLDGEFVRVYPEGEDRPGVLFPVVDARLLRQLIDELPTA